MLPDEDVNDSERWDPDEYWAHNDSEDWQQVLEFLDKPRDFSDSRSSPGFNRGPMGPPFV
jgi:hypothetical protein